MKRILLVLLVVFDVIALGSAASGLVLARWALAPAGRATGRVDFVVPRGASLAAVARRLEEERLIRSAPAMRLLARWRGLDTRVHAGEYELSASLAPEEILERLTSGQVKTYRVVLPEGLNAVQVAERLERAGLGAAEDFLHAVRDAELARELGVEGETLEGYLFPETYQLPRGLSAREIAGVLVAQFHSAWKQVAARAEARGLSMKSAVTLASIVEKETGVADERHLIAGIVHERLARGMRLEMDPTVIYGIPDFDGNLRLVHLEDAANPYNTYQIEGLPPGPIANPGLAALRAAVDPAETDYLYFVAKRDGTHEFSRTYREHVNAVNRYQRRRGQRPGGE